MAAARPLGPDPMTTARVLTEWVNFVIVEEMQKKRLGNSDMDLTPIGVGAWAMGGAGWAFAWGPQDDGESISAIHAALDHGVNWIDTAAVYGLGHSEEVVARLKEEGKVRWTGVSKCTVAQLERCRAIAPITSLQPPYSAISPEVQEALL